ncbi:MAG: MMPL family transporter, partial [Natronomonas sp.]
MNPGKRQLLAAVNTLVTERPGTVVFVFLCVTAGFAVGVGDVSTEAGTEQFTDDIPAAEAAERIDEEFSPAFRPDTGSTQLIQQGDNVLSRPGLLRMLDSQSRLLDRPRLRVTDTASAAGIVATHLDPEAETVAEQRRAVARATDGEIRTAVREADERNPRFAGLLSEDFNPEAATATATIGTLTHERPGGFDDGTGDGAESPLTPIQLESQELVTDDITVFGSGIIAAEFGTIIDDTLAIVLPAAIALITLFLLVAYRDLADLALGVVALFVTLVWTFGFMGFAGIPFSQLLIAVPPLLLAVGIDFGIHAVNRYREERVDGFGVGDGMRRANEQVLIAFFIVTVTTVIGFLANLMSSLVPIREFGIVASVGIVFTFLVFGVFLPASKVLLDRARS